MVIPGNCVWVDSNYDIALGYSLGIPASDSYPVTDKVRLIDYDVPAGEVAEECKDLDVVVPLADATGEELCELLVVTIVYSWGSSDHDLDTQTTFVNSGESGGWSCGSGGVYMSYSGDNTGEGGSETAVVHVGQWNADNQNDTSDAVISLNACWYSSLQDGIVTVQITTNRSFDQSLYYDINTVNNSCCNNLIDTVTVSRTTGEITIS